MIVYNISMKVSKTIEAEWVQWQKTEHIPDVMASGLFSEYKFYRLLEQEDPDDSTYVVQYFASSMRNYEQYLKHTAPLLRKKAFEKWGNRFIAFRSVMEVVN